MAFHRHDFSARTLTIGVSRTRRELILPVDRAAADSRRLVLGAAVGMKVEQVRFFIESLRAAGYSGSIVMLVGPTDFSLAAYLRAQGVEPRRVWFVRRLHGPIHAYRYELFARYLQEFGERYDAVLVSDVRDVVFQAHPFAGMMNQDCHFFLEGAARTIGNEPTNMLYMQLFLTPAEIEALAPHRISCCGVVLGGMPAMGAYLDRMSARLRAVPLSVRRKIGADTAFHNLMAHVTHEVPAVIVENNALVATMGIEPASRYLVGADGRIRTRDGHLPAILHQYDRLPEILAPVAARFAPGR
jgi:hypothetical protein